MSSSQISFHLDDNFDQILSTLLIEKNKALLVMDVIDIEEENFTKYSANFLNEPSNSDKVSSVSKEADICLISERSSISFSERVQNQLSKFSKIKISF